MPACPDMFLALCIRVGAAMHGPTPLPSSLLATLPIVQRSSGGGKGWGLPLRYPSQDSSPQVSARRSQPSPPLSARPGGSEPVETWQQQHAQQQAATADDTCVAGSVSLAWQHRQQQHPRRPSILGMAAVADGGESSEAEEDEEEGSACTSPRRPVGAGGFAVLAGSECGGSESGDEAAGESGNEQPAAAAVGDSGYESEGEAEEEDEGAAEAGESAADDAATAAPLFSFGAARPPPQGSHSRFAFAKSPAASPPPAASPQQPALFSFAAMAAAASPSAAAALGASQPTQRSPADAPLPAELPQHASGSGSEEDGEQQYYSAVPSRATSAALTAYASAVSLRWAQRWGGLVWRLTGTRHFWVGLGGVTPGHLHLLLASLRRHWRARGELCPKPYLILRPLFLNTSCSRSGGDSPGRSVNTPLRLAAPGSDRDGEAEGAEAAGGGAADAQRGSSGGPFVLAQLQATAQKLSKAAAAEAGSEAASGSPFDRSSVPHDGSASVQLTPRSADGADEADAALESPTRQAAIPLAASPFAGESFLAGVSPIRGPPAVSAWLQQAQQAQQQQMEEEEREQAPTGEPASPVAARCPARSPLDVQQDSPSAVRLSQMSPWSPKAVAAMRRGSSAAAPAEAARAPLWGAAASPLLAASPVAGDAMAAVRALQLQHAHEPPPHELLQVCWAPRSYPAVCRCYRRYRAS